MPKPVQQTKEVKQAKQAKQSPAPAPAVQEDEEVRNITCAEFQSNRLFFKSTELKPQSSQITCFLKYQYDTTKKATRENNDKFGEKLLMVTKPIKMVKGGIPRHNPKYHGADENSTKRAYFYIPKNAEDPNSMELFDAIDRFDDYMDDEINTKKNANGILCYKGSQGNEVKCKNITYVRMVTTAQPQSFGDEENGKVFVPWDRIKVKLSTVYDEKLGPDDRKEINTQLYVETNEEPEKISCITDIEKYFRWNCTAQFALDFNKAWVMTTKEKKCSIGIKCVQIGVTEISDFKSTASKQISKRLFGGSSTKTDTKKTVPKKEEEVEDEAVEEEEEEEAEEAEAEGEAEDEAEDEAEGEGDEAEAEAEEEEGEAEEEAEGEGEEGEEQEEQEEQEESEHEEPEPPKKSNQAKKTAPAPVKVTAKNTSSTGSKTTQAKKR